MTMKGKGILMIRIYKSEYQNAEFYSKMGKYFASLEIAKELERQLYNKPNSVWYLSMFKSSIMGFAALFDNGKYYFLDNLYVLPEHRNNGTAREIVTQIVSDNTDKPVKLIANNPYAIKIFDSLGFEEDGANGKYKKFIKHPASVLSV